MIGSTSPARISVGQRMRLRSSNQSNVLHFVAEEVKADLRPHSDARANIRIRGRLSVEREARRHEGVEALLIRLVKEAFGDKPWLLSPQTLEHRQRAVFPEFRRAARDDQPRWEIRMADGYPEGDHSAERLAEDYRFLDPEDVAEPANVFDPGVEVPAVRRALVASSLPAMVEEDELRAVCERSEEGLQRAVVETRAAMQADDGRSLPHRRPVGDEPHSFDVEVEAYISDADTHFATLCRLRTTGRPGELKRHQRGLRECAGMSLEARAAVLTLR